MSRVFVALLSVLVVAACSDDAPGRTSSTVPTTMTPAVASTVPDDAVSVMVFSWNGDDLAEWVSEDEMTEAIEQVLTIHTGGDADGELVFENVVAPGQPDEWQWTYQQTGDIEAWKVYAHDGAHGGKTDDMALTKTDPRLPDGVTYEEGVGLAHGFFMLSGPNSDESICMTLFPPGASFGYPGQYTSEVGVHKDRVFALASVMLRELGWVS